jgi:hypothetical protein
MRDQALIMNRGLFEDREWADHPIPESYDSIINLQKTIQEYREFAKPGLPSWEEYTQEIFHILGFSSETVAQRIFNLQEAGLQDGPKIRLLIISESIEKLIANGIPSHGNLSSPVDWLIITNGHEIRISASAASPGLARHFWTNLDGILDQEQSDSFFLFYKAMSFIRTNKNITSKKHPIHKQPAPHHDQKESDELYGLQHYVDQFSNLRTDVNHQRWPAALHYRAPHKPFLLLSILCLYDQGFLPQDLIEISPELVNQFKTYWAIFNIPAGNIALPFFHLRSSSFWNLIPGPGFETKLLSTGQVGTVAQLINLILGAKLDPNLDFLLHVEKYRTILRTALIQTYFAPEYSKQLLNPGKCSVLVIEKNNQTQASPLTNPNNNFGLVSGYIELGEYPDFPSHKTPTKNQCEGFTYISMVQLCNLSESFGKTRRIACRAFGGDNGDIPVIPERQTRVAYGHKPWKFVLIPAVEEFFSELGIDW